jgi:predicted amidophosphoribosyltransferase
MTVVENPPLELALAGIILVSLVMVALNLVRRSGHRGSVVCSRCGFNNLSARKYCVNCGETLKGS